MSVMLCNSMFAGCTPPEEFFEYPIYFPRDRYADATPPPSDVDELESERVVIIQKPPEPPRNVKKEKFDEFMQSIGKSGTPAMSAYDAGNFARKQGVAPSQADIQRLHVQHGDNVTLDQLYEWIGSCTHPEDRPDKLEEFFLHYDPQHKGTLSRSQVKILLSSYGEPLTDEEVNAILTDMGFTQDPINYREFIDKLLVKD